MNKPVNKAVNPTASACNQFFFRQVHQKEHLIPQVLHPYWYAVPWSHLSSVLCLPSSSHHSPLVPSPLCRYLRMTEHGPPTKSHEQMGHDSSLASPSHSKEGDSCKDHCSATNAVDSCQPHHESRGRSVKGTTPNSKENATNAKKSIQC